MARVILQCRHQSHPFNDRDIFTNEPIKIGRAVANCKPGTDNCFFNCKVLSRNHAVLWYENGKFFLQDTQSSNGTFVNNQKLPPGPAPPSPGGQGTLKSDPATDGRKEVTSGDLVQFGVEVVEQPKKGIAPMTHGCIIASLKLFHPDGSEAKPPPGKAPAAQNPAVDGGPGRDDKVDAPKLSMQEIYELQSVLQEAHHREHVLESKLASLNKILLAVERRDTWTATFQEDLLLSKIQHLQAQVNFYEAQLKHRPNGSVSRSVDGKAGAESTMNDDDSISPSMKGDSASQSVPGGDDHNTFLTKVRDANYVSDDYKLMLMAEWKNMVEERAHFENVAKDTLQRVVGEKSELCKSLAVAEERLAIAQTEATDLTAMCQHNQKEFLDLVDKFQRQSQEVESLSQKYQESERVKLECLDTLKLEKASLEEQLHFYKEKCDYNMNIYDELARHSAELQEQVEQLKAQKLNAHSENMSAGELVWTNGLSAESNDEEDENDQRRDIRGMGDNLTEQSLPENIFQGKNVAQLVQEFGNASDDDERHSGRQNTRDGPVFLRNEDVIRSYASHERRRENNDGKLVRMEDGNGGRHADENISRAAENIAELLIANERLTEIVEKLQDDLAQERDDKASIASSRETVEAGTSPDDVFGSHQSFVRNLSAMDDTGRSTADAEIQVQDDNPFMNMELTALCDELEATVRADVSRVQRPPTQWWSDLSSAVLADPTAAVALLLVLVWYGFSCLHGT